MLPSERVSTQATPGAFAPMTGSAAQIPGGVDFQIPTPESVFAPMKRAQSYNTAIFDPKALGPDNYLFSFDPGHTEGRTVPTLFLPDVNRMLLMRRLYDEAVERGVNPIPQDLAQARFWPSEAHEAIATINFLGILATERATQPGRIYSGTERCQVAGYAQPLPNVWFDAISGSEVGFAFKFVQVDLRTGLIQDGTVGFYSKHLSTRERASPSTISCLQCVPMTNSTRFIPRQLAREYAEHISELSKKSLRPLEIQRMRLRYRYAMLNYYDIETGELHEGAYIPIGTIFTINEQQPCETDVLEAMTSYGAHNMIKTKYKTVGLYLGCRAKTNYPSVTYIDDVHSERH